MGGQPTRLYDYVTEKKRMTVFMFGLEDVGKTTIFYKLTLRDNDPMPTIGLKLYEIDVENVKFTIWHAGWTETIKRMWNRYEEKDTESLAVLYVVDSSDKARIDQAREDLHQYLREEQFKKAGLLVLANKQDICTMSVAQIVDKLALHSLRNRQWHIQGTSVVLNEGIRQGLQWLMSVVTQRNDLYQQICLKLQFRVC